MTAPSRVTSAEIMSWSLLLVTCGLLLVEVWLPSARLATLALLLSTFTVFAAINAWLLR